MCSETFIYYFFGMKEKFEYFDDQLEKKPELFIMNVRNKVVLTLLKDSSLELFKKLILVDELTRKKLLNMIIIKILDNSSDSQINTFIEDINHTCERSDGSSDGLHEALDIVLENGYRECSNWNTDLHQIWNLKQLFPVEMTLEPEDEIKLFKIIWEVKFPEKVSLTWKEQRVVYEIMKKFLDEVKVLIGNLV